MMFPQMRIGIDYALTATFFRQQVSISELQTGGVFYTTTELATIRSAMERAHDFHNVNLDLDDHSLSISQTFLITHSIQKLSSILRFLLPEEYRQERDPLVLESVINASRILQDRLKAYGDGIMKILSSSTSKDISYRLRMSIKGDLKKGDPDFTPSAKAYEELESLVSSQLELLFPELSQVPDHDNPKGLRLSQLFGQFPNN